LEAKLIKLFTFVIIHMNCKGCTHTIDRTQLFSPITLNILLCVLCKLFAITTNRPPGKAICFNSGANTTIQSCWGVWDSREARFCRASN